MYKLFFFLISLILLPKNSQALDPFSVFKFDSPKGCSEVSIHQTNLTSADLIELGICRNPILSRSYMSIKEQEASVGQTKSAYLPIVSGSINASNSLSKVEGTAKRFYSNGYNAGVGVQWLVFDFGVRSGSLDTVLSLLETSEFSYNEDMQQLALGINIAYFDLLSGKEILKIAKENESLYKNTYLQVNKKFQNGKATDSNRLLAKTVYEQSKLAVIEAKKNVKLFQANLAKLLNTPPETEFNLASPAKMTSELLKLNENKSIKEYIDFAIAERSALKAARSAEKASGYRVEVEKARGLPSLNLNASTNYSDSFTNKNPYGIGASIGLSINVPLFTGFNDLYSTASARYAQKRAQYDTIVLVDDVKNEVWSRYYEYQESLDLYETNQGIYNTAVESEKAAAKAYVNGTESLLNLLTAQNQLVTARVSKIASFYTTMINKASFYRSLGSL